MVRRGWGGRRKEEMWRDSMMERKEGSGEWERDLESGLRKKYVSGVYSSWTAGFKSSTDRT